MNVTSLLEPQLRAMGRRLREERLARDINPRALETDLRTTHRHLLAIEEGQTRLFYSESFFCDLFTRYAITLGFSPEEAQEMVVTLRTPTSPVSPLAPPASDKNPAAASSASEPSSPPEGLDPPDTGDTSETASEVRSDSEAQAVASEPALAAQPPDAETSMAETSSAQLPFVYPAQTLDTTEEGAAGSAKQPAIGPLQSNESGPKAAPQKSPFSTVFFALLVAVVLLFWLVSQEDDEAALAPAPMLVTESEKSESAQKPAADSDLAPPVAAASSASPVPSADAGLKPAVSPSPAPPASTASPAFTANEPVGSPELELTFRMRGWVWVREANDSVREFVVPEGGTVRFQEMPIFIVLPAPDQIDALVSGRPVSLRRTEEEKNQGRYTRTMLRQAANLGRPPSPPAN